MFAVIGTETYCKELEKWPKADKDAADTLPAKLAENPHAGDPLGYRFLREKKIRERRVYYLVYDDRKLVLLVATSGKKDQQATIDHIKKNLDEFRVEAERIIRQGV